MCGGGISVIFNRYVMGGVLFITGIFLFAGFHMYGISENVLLKILTESKSKREYEKRKRTNYTINFLCINAFELDVFRSRDILHWIKNVVIDNSNKYIYIPIHESIRYFCLYFIKYTCTY
jgi:hypothetical protein